MDNYILGQSTEKKLGIIPGSHVSDLNFNSNGFTVSCLSKLFSWLFIMPTHRKNKQTF